MSGHIRTTQPRRGQLLCSIREVERHEHGKRNRKWGITIKPKHRTINLIYFLIIAIVVWIIVLQTNQNIHKSELIVKQKINADHISSTEMSRVVYSNNELGAQIKFEDVELKQDQIENITRWINNAPEAAITVMDKTPSNISIGIVFKLKSRKEIRIQYNLEKIFITRTDIHNSMVKYSIEQEQLKEFFDEELKGFYFGKDKIEDS